MMARIKQTTRVKPVTQKRQLASHAAKKRTYVRNVLSKITQSDVDEMCEYIVASFVKEYTRGGVLAPYYIKYVRALERVMKIVGKMIIGKKEDYMLQKHNQHDLSRSMETNGLRYRFFQKVIELLVDYRIISVYAKNYMIRRHTARTRIARWGRRQCTRIRVGLRVGFRVGQKPKPDILVPYIEHADNGNVKETGYRFSYTKKRHLTFTRYHADTIDNVLVVAECGQYDYGVKVGHWVSYCGDGNTTFERTYDINGAIVTDNNNGRTPAGYESDESESESDDDGENTAAAFSAPIATPVAAAEKKADDDTAVTKKRKRKLAAPPIDLTQPMPEASMLRRQEPAIKKRAGGGSQKKGYASTILDTISAERGIKFRFG